MGEKKTPTLGFRPRKEAHQVKLNHMLDFGVEKNETDRANDGTNETTKRLNQLLRKLQELNQRVDAINQRY